MHVGSVVSHGKVRVSLEVSCRRAKFMVADSLSEGFVDVCSCFLDLVAHAVAQVKRIIVRLPPVDDAERVAREWGDVGWSGLDKDSERCQSEERTGVAETLVGEKKEDVGERQVPNESHLGLRVRRILTW